VTNLNSYIDLTLLKPDTTRDQIEQLCSDAITYNAYSVCVPPYFVQQCSRILEDYPVKVCTVINFPYGNSLSQVKAEEIKKAVDDNVDEVDIVAPISAMKSGDWTYVMSEFESLTRLSHMRNIVCKWIIEINLLTEEEIAQVCKIGVAKEVDFIKTSTGTYGEAVTPEAIARLRALLPPQVKIKASGGIRTREQAEELIASGADRIGASSKKLLTNT